MENEVVDPQKEDHKKDDLLHSSKGEKLSGKSGPKKFGTPLIRQNPHHSPISDGKQLEIVENGSKDSFFRVNKKIPRHVVSLDEKYLHRCLELIHMSASKSASCVISLNLTDSVTMGVSPFHLGSAVTTKEIWHDLARFVSEFPLAVAPRNAAAGSTTAGYKSIMHMLDRPLLQKFGALDFVSNITGTRSNGVKGSISCEVTSSPGGLSDYSRWRKQEKDMTDLRDKNYGYGPDNVHKRLFSPSSTESTCSSSNHSLSSTSTAFSQGMLQCAWKDGVPHFVFSLDDKKEVYLAELSEPESFFAGEASAYSFLIHLRKGCGGEAQLVGKTNVSTTVSLSPTNSKVLETEFILLTNGENSQIPCHDVRKNKGLPKKVVDAFRNSRSSRQRSLSRFSKTSFTVDFRSWELFQDTSSVNLEPINLLEKDLPPNIESAAIILKQNIPEDQRQEVVGGWGMKFLNKVSLSRNLDITSEESQPLMNMNVITAAGVHGGPRTRNGGPSSLTERWKSGGNCDCGGWDLGCPLTVFKGQQGKHESSYQEDGEDHCKLFELFIEGSRHGAPGLRIANVHDGLYFLQFQSKLSPLQSFSIGMAYIHSQNPRFQEKKKVQGLK